MPQAVQAIQAPIGIVTGFRSGFYREPNGSQSQRRMFPVAPPSFVWVANWELNLPIRIFSSSPRRHSIAPFPPPLYSNTLDVNV